MRKIFSIFAAMLVALAVNAQTDFSTPYSCMADDAVLTGGSSSNFFLKSDVTPHCVAWSDVSLSSNAKATWTINATRGCYVSVSLDLGPVIASNKHNFEIRIYDSNNNLKGMVTEGGENTASEQVKAIDGTILIPLPGTYTVEVYNNRDWGKGAIKSVILSYAADAPSEIVDVTAVELNKSEVTLDLYEVELLTATVSPDNATDPSVTWTSNNEEVATVNENGLILAVGEGNATISAKAGDITASCAVTVASAAYPEVDFAEPYVLAGKVAHLEGAIWKNEAYKLYGDGGHNKNYGNAYWTINVTKACVVSATLNGVEGGHEFVLDLYQGEELLASVAQPDGKTWSAGDIALDGNFTFPAAGTYTFKLRNTQEWSSGKVGGVTLTFVEDVQPQLTKYYLKNNWDGAGWTWKEMSPMDNGSGTYYILDAVVFGGTGVNVNTEIMDETATWIPMENFVDMDEEDGLTIGALDTVVFYYVPSQSNVISYNIIGKYVDPISEHTYTVAGSSVAVFGTQWDKTNTANDMIKDEMGIYRFEKTEVTLAAGTISFKVVKDYDWDKGAWPASDYNLNIPEAGIYTISITFDPSTGTVAAEATKTGSAEVVPEVKLHGDFTGTWADTNPFITNPGNTMAQLSIDLVAGTYEFGMKFDGTWKANGATVTREISQTTMSTGSGNMHIVADFAGLYIFSYVFENESLTVTYPNQPGEGIDNTNANVQSVKRLENGILVIEKNGHTYNAMGIRIR